MGLVNIVALEGGPARMGSEQPVRGQGTSQNVTSSATTASATAMPAGTKEFRISTDTAIKFRWGSGAQTAVATDQRLPAGAVEYRRCSAGDIIAVIDE